MLSNQLLSESQESDPFDIAFHEALAKTLGELETTADEEAFRDL